MKTYTVVIKVVLAVRANTKKEAFENGMEWVDQTMGDGAEGTIGVNAVEHVETNEVRS